jgi:hypothetical protein
MSTLTTAAIRVAAVVSVLALVLALPGCGAGGGGGGPYTTVTVENEPTSEDSITQVRFDFFDVSGISDRVEDVLVAPGEEVTFEFDQFESDNFLSMTVTWSDLDETFVPLLFVSGGDFSYPLLH